MAAISLKVFLSSLSAINAECTNRYSSVMQLCLFTIRGGDDSILVCIVSFMLKLAIFIFAFEIVSMVFPKYLLFRFESAQMN